MEETNSSIRLVFSNTYLRDKMTHVNQLSMKYGKEIIRPHTYTVTDDNNLNSVFLFPLSLILF